MPKKSRRVAAKQAELGQRKRRAAKHHSEIEASVPVARVGATTRVEMPVATTATPTQETPALSVPRRVTQERPAPVPTHRSYNPYIWTEIKRIGISTGLILIILGVITVVLR